ncbi:leucyl aminopeptidase [Pseudolysinimonas sp.]|uniref:leucyl aminopeptidase n=1 Tax=Pseudolysinimonas sp. TaxID=2680009 RepID=UPI003F7EFE5C
MTSPALAFRTDPLVDVDADVLVVGVVPGDDGPRLASDHPALAGIDAALASIGATGRAEQLVRVPSPEGFRAPLALLGLGAAEPTPDALRTAAGAAARQLAGVGTVAFALPGADSASLSAVAEGAALGAYAFAGYRTEAPIAPVERVELVVTAAPDEPEALLARAAAVADAVHGVRDLASTAPNLLDPAALAQAAVDAARDLPVEVEVLDEQELAAGGFGGILAVGKGSTRPPRLVVVRYAPEGAERHLALVGKGITYDSGGYSMKTVEGLIGMKYDMTGAAAVLHVVLAAARLGLPIRLTAWLCIAENMVSGDAMRPDDVITIRGGRTVEVLNTDAEGRLVMADGIVAASEEQPDAIVDVATLTGGARIALGERIIPVMGDAELSERMVAAGERVGETLWRMPLPSDVRTLLDSDVADILNSRPGKRQGHMLQGGLFLQFFVGTRPDGTPIPWAHLDIAGPANNPGGAYGFTPKGPTGTAVRTLLALTEDFARKG